MTNISFSFGGTGDSPTIHVTIQETSALKAVQQFQEFTKEWLNVQAGEECAECEAVLNLPDADFSGEKN